jgi:hypothetical protein
MKTNFEIPDDAKDRAAFNLTNTTISKDIMG